jgi:Zn-dependent protease
LFFFLVDVFIYDPFIGLLFTPVLLLTFGVSILTALTVHEYGHAYVAHLLGDSTARESGRLSFNPIKHLDLFGTLMFIFVGFGWGKPVPINFYLLKKSPISLALIAGAGPATNFFCAIIISIFVRMLNIGPVPFSYALNPQYRLANINSLDIWLGALATFMVFYNLMLGLFNLIPLAPLDGSKILIGLAPRHLIPVLLRFESKGIILLFLLIGIDIFFGVSIIGNIVLPPLSLLSEILLGEMIIN